MFGISRKTRGQLMRSELGESWDHFLQAASHAANGVGSSVGPGAAKMRGLATRGAGTTAAAFAPLAAAYKEGAADALKLSAKARKAKKGKRMSSNRKTGMLVGLLAAGVAVGAAGALVMRRRKKQQWSEYDSGNLGFESGSGVSRDAKYIVDKAANKTDSAMDKVAHHANKAMDKTADKLESTASSIRNSDFKSKVDDAKSGFKSKIDDAAEAVNDATDSKFSTSKQNGRY
jgi:hypothetical protein